MANRDAATGVVTTTTQDVLADGRRFGARQTIAFPVRGELADAIAAAGLAVDIWYGDAGGGPLRPDCPDLIPVGRLAI